MIVPCCCWPPTVTTVVPDPDAPDVDAPDVLRAPDFAVER